MFAAKSKCFLRVLLTLRKLVLALSGLPSLNQMGPELRSHLPKESPLSSSLSPDTNPHILSNIGRNFLKLPQEG